MTLQSGRKDGREKPIVVGSEMEVGEIRSLNE